MRKKLLTMILVATMTLGLMPSAAFAAEDVSTPSEDELLVLDSSESGDPGQEPTEETEPADPISVNMTIYNEGAPVLMQQNIEVEDADSDGSITYDEALQAAHSLYCPDGFEISDGGWVTKLWNVENSGYLFRQNDIMFSSLVNETEIADGDELIAAVMQDTTYWSDHYVYFTDKNVSVAAGETISLTLQADKGMDASSALPAGVKVGVLENGTFTEYAVADAEGKVELNFDEAGTYVLAAQGTISDEVITDYTTEETMTYDCPIFSGFCTVTVTPPEPADPISVNMTIYNGGVPVLMQQDIEVEDADSDGSITYDEALQTAHDLYCPGGFEISDGGWVTKLWNVENSGYLFRQNDIMFSSLVNETKIAEGDELIAAVMQDTTYWSDHYVYFTDKNVSVAAGETISLTLQADKGMDASSALTAGVKVGVLENGSFTEYAAADETGKVELSFAEGGTYVLTAQGTISDEVMDYSTMETMTYDCPIFAGFCVVKVIDPILPYDGDEVIFVKDDLVTPFGMLRPQEGSTYTTKGDNLVIHIVPKNKTVYNAFHWGTILDDPLTSDVVFDENGLIDITLPKDHCGFAYAIAPIKVKDGTTAADQYYLAIPGLDKFPADYSAVDEAKAEAEALDASLYTEKSYTAVTDAVNAIVEGKTAAEQDEVDAMAAVINAAIDNLVYIYSGDELYFVGDDLETPFGMLRPQEGSAWALNGDNIEIHVIPKNKVTYGWLHFGAYTDSELTKDVTFYEDGSFDLVLSKAEYCGTAHPIAPVKRENGATSSKQYYLAIPTEDHFSAMADYTAVNAAKEKAAAVDTTPYTPDSVKALNKAVAAAYIGRTADQQAEVDALAQAIEDAINALVPRKEIAEDITLEAVSYVYDGTEKTPAVTVKDGETILAEGTDYTVEYADNAEVGTAAVTVTLIGNYIGTKTTTFKIVPARAVISAVANVTGGVKLTWKEAAGAGGYEVYRRNGTTAAWTKVTTIAEGTTVTYTDTKASASNMMYTYRIRAFKTVDEADYYGAYSVMKFATRMAAPKTTPLQAGFKVTWNKVTGADGYKVYRKAAGGSWSVITTIKKGTTVTYSDTKATVNGKLYYYLIRPYKTISGKNYDALNSSARKYYYLTRPAVPTASNTAARTMTVTWKKNAKASGYQVKYVTGSTTKTVTITKNSTLKRVIKSLAKGKTYKVYIRSYKKVSGVNYYSAWSKAKSVKITK